MALKMHDWITSGERELPLFLTPFAKSASGSSKADDEDDDEEDDDEDDDDEDDDDADKSEDDLRAELKTIRASLAKANGQSAKRRKALRAREAELEEARKPKPAAKKKADDDDAPDLDTIRHEAKTEGQKEGLARAKRSEAKAALLGSGANPERVTKAIGLLDLDDLDLDDDGLDGIEDAIEDLRKTWPELFAKKRQKRESVAGGNDRNGDERRGGSGGRQAKTASQIAADRILSRS